MARLSVTFAKRLAILEASPNLTPAWHGDKQAACRAYAAMLDELTALSGSATSDGLTGESLGGALANPIVAAEAYSELIRTH